MVVLDTLVQGQGNRGPVAKTPAEPGVQTLFSTDRPQTHGRSHIATDSRTVPKEPPAHRTLTQLDGMDAITAAATASFNVDVDSENSAHTAPPL